MALRTGSQFMQDLKAVHLRYIQIEEHQRRTVPGLLQIAQRLLPIFDDIDAEVDWASAQHFSNNEHVGWAVLYQQHRIGLAIQRSLRLAAIGGVRGWRSRR